ncbi:3-oxoadipate enol-lactonase [Micromonospora sp. U21]|uniref:3-oxoadipate enol-lactonase n=1 Tax=Micromonospora sp. U21 TaxID=2824899 RepID=UPI001B38A7E9|nr:3-oxoadipate enol-lactonase [Micromonospora sp. U21]MBQ0902061.1 3-oxoadipate enol-lactonase [Micromonospora sp. U21]
MTSQLHASVDGPPDAPVLILGSSLGTTAAMWQRQVPQLAERFRVVRYDHLGHGLSAVPPGPYTIEQLGRELLALMDDLRVSRAHHAGLSLGGMVAMWVAARAPERVDRLALLCTSPSLGPAEMWRDRAATVRAAGLEVIADAVVARWFTPALAATRPEVVAAHRAMLTAIPATGYAACCEAIAAMDLRDDLPRIRAATLVVAGGDDPATPVRHGRAIVERIPGARLAVLEQAAHLANVEQPEQVSRLLSEHFEQVVSG